MLTRVRFEDTKIGVAEEMKMMTSLNARDHDKHEAGEHSNLRGVLTLMVCSGLLVGMAYVAMVLLTSPDGWVADATLTTFHPNQPTIMAANEPVVE